MLLQVNTKGSDAVISSTDRVQNTTYLNTTHYSNIHVNVGNTSMSDLRCEVMMNMMAERYLS